MALLVFSEIGAIFFIGIASQLPAHRVRFNHWFINLDFNIVAVACYFWAVLCAMVALAANITITVDHWHEFAGREAIAVFETLLPPLTSLYIGGVGDRLILSMSALRNAGKAEYNYAVEYSRYYLANPTKHDDYELELQKAILAELFKYGNNRALLENDRTLQAIAFQVEKRDMSELLEFIDISAILVNPTMAVQKTE